MLKRGWRQFPKFVPSIILCLLSCTSIISLFPNYFLPLPCNQQRSSNMFALSLPQLFYIYFWSPWVFRVPTSRWRSFRPLDFINRAFSGWSSALWLVSHIHMTSKRVSLVSTTMTPKKSVEKAMSGQFLTLAIFSSRDSQIYLYFIECLPIFFNTVLNYPLSKRC